MPVANLDFEARVPVPFSVFPSSYKEKAEAESKTQITHEELEIRLPEKAGREGQYSSGVHAPAHLPPRREQHRFNEEEVRFTREEERYHRPGVKVHEEYRPKHSRPHSFSNYQETVEVDNKYRPQYTAIDNIEHAYRSRSQAGYQEPVRAGTTVDAPLGRPSSSYNNYANVSATVDTPVSQPTYTEQIKFTGSTVSPPKSTPSVRKESKVVEETVEYPQHTHSVATKSRMGYYDEDGHYHSFRHGLHKMADKILPHHDHHIHHHDVEVMRESAAPAGPVGPTGIPNTVTIPCHHIRNGDILVLQGRPCQVIRISTSSATGQHRYLGVDLFTKQLHEESSFISHPSPSVVVQTMLGPVLKQYRVLDMSDGTITCMTESGEVKQGLTVLDQANLWEKVSRAFNTGRGSVRVLVLADNGRELAVDVKVVHGSSL
ncbi:hypothetical protein MGN70_012942 [Eutypa lata]|nr:hypothetical protein MGN70_012942 [Eutypa lata]